jgi:serpin B
MSRARCAPIAHQRPRALLLAACCCLLLALPTATLALPPPPSIDPTPPSPSADDADDADDTDDEDKAPKHPLRVSAPALFDGQTALTLKVFEALRAPADANIAFSTVSISSAIAMTAAGARGATADGILHTLGWPDATLHAPFGALLSELQHGTGRDPDDTYGEPATLNIANALWVKDGFPIEATFADALSRDYGATITPLDFSKPTAACATINKALSAATNGLIPDALPCSAITPATRFVLSNAVYFRARWRVEFSPEETKTQPFTLPSGQTTPAPLMTQGPTRNHRYTEDDLAQVVELGYRDYRFAAVLVLPLKKNNLPALEAALTPARLHAWFTQDDAASPDSPFIDLTIFIPRFSFSAGIPSMRSLLSDLGMAGAFDASAADFSGISQEKVWLDDATHRAFIRFDEEGTEAAATTTMVGFGGSGMSHRKVIQKTFRADHPFLFFILDRDTDTILFMGRVSHPDSE